MIDGTQKTHTYKNNDKPLSLSVGLQIRVAKILLNGIKEIQQSFGLFTSYVFKLLAQKGKKNIPTRNEDGNTFVKHESKQPISIPNP